jgi:hypothetical protein
MPSYTFAFVSGERPQFCLWHLHGEDSTQPAKALSQWGLHMGMGGTLPFLWGPQHHPGLSLECSTSEPCTFAVPVKATES